MFVTPSMMSASVFPLGLMVMGTTLLSCSRWCFAVVAANLALSPPNIMSYLNPKERVAPYVVVFAAFDAAALPPPSWVAWLVVVLAFEAETSVHSSALPVEVLALAMVG